MGRRTSPPRGWPPHLGFPWGGSGGVHVQLSFGGEVGVHLQLSLGGSWSPPPSPLGRRTKGLGQPPNPPLPPIYRGAGPRGETHNWSSVSLDRLLSSPFLQILLPGYLTKPCRISSSTSTTTPSCCWTLRGDLHHHLRCSLERGGEGRHRLRTRDRGRKCCRNAAPDDRLQQHTRYNLVRLWNLRGLVSIILVAQILID